jgi:hypothetical protein
MNGHDPYAYLKDVLTRLPTQRTREIGRKLPTVTVFIERKMAALQRRPDVVLRI